MSQLTPKFSANRTVREYTEQYHLPAAANFLNRAAENGAAGIRIIAAKQNLENKWKGINASPPQVENVPNGYHCRVVVQLNGINTPDVTVEMYAEENNGRPAEIYKMIPQPNGGEAFEVQFSSSRPVTDFTLRIKRSYESIQVPLENELIFWQH